MAGHYVQCWPDIVSVPGRELRPYRPVSSSGCSLSFPPAKSQFDFTIPGSSNQCKSGLHAFLVLTACRMRDKLYLRTIPVRFTRHNRFQHLATSYQPHSDQISLCTRAQRIRIVKEGWKQRIPAKRALDRFGGRVQLFTSRVRERLLFDCGGRRNSWKMTEILYRLS